MSGLYVRIAWVLPGQGSLRTGCVTAVRDGRGSDDLARLARAAGDAVDAVTDVIGRDVESLADDQSAGARTADAQPTILAASLAAAAALRATGLQPDVVAGHSLGECGAAVVAGSLTARDGARVVDARGRAMGEACAATPGAMAAVVKLAPAAVASLLEGRDDVVVANDNAPGQVVVAGSPDAVKGLRDDVRAAGGRLVPLDVEGAFHSPAMEPAVDALAAALADTNVSDPQVPIVSGVSAEPLTTGAQVADALVAGIRAPVRWREVQLALHDLEVTHLIEVGPGGVLAGLARRTVPELQVHGVATPADAHDLAVELGVLAGAR